MALYEGETYQIRKWDSFPNAVIKTSSYYCIMIPKTENGVTSKEIIIS